MMSGMANDINSSAKKGMAKNSLLTAAASHSLVDDDNLLLLQDISLQDEPAELPATTDQALIDETHDEGESLEFPRQGDAFGYGLSAQPLLENHDINNVRTQEANDEAKAGLFSSYLNVFGKSNTSAAASPSNMLEVNAPNTVSHSEPVSHIASTDQIKFDTNEKSHDTYASSLFQTSSTSPDPFQVSMAPPPSVTALPASNPYTLNNLHNKPSAPPISDYSRHVRPIDSTIMNTSIPETSSQFSPAAGPLLKPTPTTFAPLHPSTSSPALNQITQNTLSPSPSVPLFNTSQENPYFGNGVSSFTPPQGNNGNYNSNITQTNQPSLNSVHGQMPHEHSQSYHHPASYSPNVSILNPVTGYQNQVADYARPSANSLGNFSTTSLANQNVLPPASATGIPPPPQQGTISPGGQNQYRLPYHKPVYAPYPGIPATMGQSSSSENDSEFVPQVLQPETTSFTNISEQHSALYNFGGPVIKPTPVTPVVYQYVPPEYHWFYKKEIDGRHTWKPFSIKDSLALEQGITNNVNQVSTNGGRYDIDIAQRLRKPVYWEETNPTEVRRSSWFYKGPMETRFTPYDEQFSQKLEQEYHQRLTSGAWHKRLELGGGEVIIFQNPSVVFHFCQAASPEDWGNMPEHQLRPRTVKRGVEEFEFEEGESSKVDHLVFVVHGIGSVCDFRFRNLVEAVDDFRSLSYQLSQSHFKDAVNSENAGRIEFLPIQWHEALHGDGGIDERLKPISLKSIPKLRSFTNDTLLDILFYTSPVYSQTIVDTVANEMNRLYRLFCSRNPGYNGKVALAGHSLGSLILFDILSHQPEQMSEKKETKNAKEIATGDSRNVVEQLVSEENKLLEKSESTSRIVSYNVGSAGSGTGIQMINYPILEFHPTAFFAMGSPIAMFVTVRGVEQLGENFRFPTVPTFLNIFHPFDPVAYRIEPLVDPRLELRPVLIPHHKGRKRFHLELKDTMTRVGTDLKNKFLDSVRNTWNTVYQIASFGRSENLEQDIDRVISGELSKEELANEFENRVPNTDEAAELDVIVGKLNEGRRIDYVLQEAPVEILNEYIFALSSHVVYWSSEDTMLLIMKEIYQKLGVSPDAEMPSSISTPAFMPSNQEIRFQPTLPVNSSLAATNYSHNIGQGIGIYSPNTHSPLSILSPRTSDAPLVTPMMYDVSTQPVQSSLSTSLFNSRSIPRSSGSGVLGHLGARPIVSPDQFPTSRGMDPTAPMMSTTELNIGPPPLSGFVGTRK